MREANGASVQYFSTRALHHAPLYRVQVACTRQRTIDVPVAVVPLALCAVAMPPGDVG